MPVMQITEYSDTGTGTAPQDMPIAREPAVGSQSFSFSTATNSTAFSNSTAFIRMVSDTDCHIKFDGTATTGDEKVIAGQPEWRAVSAAAVVSVIQA